MLGKDLSNETKISRSQYINQLFDDLKRRILNLDELSLSFFKKLKSWDIIVKHDVRIYYNHFSKNRVTKISNILSSQKGKQALKQYSQRNIYNILLSISYNAFYFALYFLVLPNLSQHLFKIYGHHSIYSGVIISVTHIGEFVGGGLSLFWIKKSYKFTLLLSTFMLSISQLLYCFSYNFNSVTMIILSRFFLGMGNERILNKKYITEYVNKIDIVKYGKLFTYFTFIGSAFGLMITLIFIIIDGDYELWGYFNLNYITNPSWVCLLISLILFGLIMCYYTDPYNHLFSIYESDGIYNF